MKPFASGRIVEGAIHVLPQTLDVERILADEPPGARLQRVARPAFADAGDIGVGLDGDDHVALQQRDLERHHVGCLVEPDPRDLCLRQRGLRRVTAVAAPPPTLLLSFSEKCDDSSRCPADYLPGRPRTGSGSGSGVLPRPGAPPGAAPRPGAAAPRWRPTVACRSVLDHPRVGAEDVAAQILRAGVAEVLAVFERRVMRP